MKTRTLVVDDDAIARARALTLLAAEPDIEIVGESGNGPHVPSLIDTTAPALIVAGAPLAQLDAAATIGRERSGRPLVIVLGDSYEYAVHAFDIGAIDYVLKPFTGERFWRALTRARRQLAYEEALRATAIRDPVRRDCVMIKSRGSVHLLRYPEIHWCEAVGNYVHVHAEATTHVTRSTLAHLEAQLDSGRFVRVHRSLIVNVDVIRELRCSPGGDYTITLCDSTQLTLSRGYRKVFERVLGQSLSRS